VFVAFKSWFRKPWDSMWEEFSKENNRSTIRLYYWRTNKSVLDSLKYCYTENKQGFKLNEAIFNNKPEQFFVLLNMKLNVKKKRGLEFDTKELNEFQKIFNKPAKKDMKFFFKSDLISSLWPHFTKSAEYKKSMAPFVDPAKRKKLDDYMKEIQNEIEFKIYP